MPDNFSFDPLSSDPQSVSQSQQTKSGFGNFMQKSLEQGLANTHQQTAEKQGSGLSFVSPDMVDKYTAQEDYNPMGFNPYAVKSNIESFAKNETIGSALAKGFDSFAYNFGNTFTEWFTDYGKMASAAFNGDWDKMKPSEDEMINQYYHDQINSNKNFVFLTPENEDTIWNKRTMSEFLGNSGFALGTFGALGLEILADTLITAVTLPAGGEGAVTFGATAAKLAGKIGMKAGAREGAKIGSNIAGDLLRGFGELGSKTPEQINILRKLNEAEAVAKVSRPYSEIASESVKSTFGIFEGVLNVGKSTSLLEGAANVAKAVPILGTGIKYGEKVAAGINAGLKTGEVLGIGLQGVRRVAQELNMSASEAAFEAVSSYGDTLNNMVEYYRQNNDGQNPDGVEFEKMRKLALEASSKNYDTNLAILALTNKIEFGALFSKYLPANNIARKLVEDVAEDVMTVQTKSFAKVYEKGAFGTIGLTRKIAQDFGAKQAAWEVAKSFGRNFGRMELTEGLQENLQEASASGWQNYYSSKYKGVEKTLSESMSQGIGEQFSKQGFKTFLMGAFTGSIIRIPTYAATKAMNAANQAVVNRQYKGQENPFTKAKEQLKQDIDIVNDNLKQWSEGKFKDKLFNFASQINTSQQKTEAAAKNNRYEFENARDNALISAVHSAKRTNSIEALIQAVKNSGITMSEEDFKAAYGIDIKDSGFSSVKEFADNVAGKLKNYSETLDSVRRKMGSLVDPTVFKNNKRNRNIANFIRARQEEAIEIIALNALKGGMSADRAKQVANDLTSIPGLTTSSAFMLRVLAEPNALHAEVGHMMSEIALAKSQLKSITDPQLKKELEQSIKLKEQHIEDLSTWIEFHGTREETLTNDQGQTKQERYIDIFKGKKVGQREITDENGNVVGKEDEYQSNHDEVKETFRKLVNNRNKQDGNNTELTESQVSDAFDKILDYIQLDRDTKDYMNAVDTMGQKKVLETMIPRMIDGNFKWRMITAIDQIDMHMQHALLSLVTSYDLTEEQLKTYINKFRESVYESEEYKKLTAFVENLNTTYLNYEYGFQLTDKINDIIMNKLAEFQKELEPYSDDITTEEYDTFKNEGTVSEETKNKIATNIYSGNSLSPEATEIYNAFKSDIDKIVNDKNASYKERRKQAGNKYATGTTSKRGVNGTAKFIHVNDKRFAEDILREYDVKDGDTVSLKDFVQKAIDNPLTHPYIKTALNKFINSVANDAEIKVDSTQAHAPAFYDPNTNIITIDPELVNSGLMSFESVLLHELIHYFSSNELYKFNSPFTQKVLELYNHASQYILSKGINPSDYYGFTNEHEFLAEAYTNADFQEELSNIPSIKPTKNILEELLDALSKFLKDLFKVDLGPSVLLETMETLQSFVNDSLYNTAYEGLIEMGTSPGLLSGMTKVEILELARKNNIIPEEESIIKDIKYKVTYDTELGYGIGDITTNAPYIDEKINEAFWYKTFDEAHVKLEEIVTGVKSTRDPVSQSEYDKFIDDGLVSDDRIKSIAEKVQKKQELSPREQAMFNSQVPIVEDILKKQKELEDSKQEKTSTDARADIERRRQEEFDQYSNDIIVKAELYEDGEGQKYLVYTLKNGKKRLDTANENGQRTSTIDVYEGSVPIKNYITDAKKIKDVETNTSKRENLINAKYDAELAALEGKQAEDTVDITEPASSEEFSNMQLAAAMLGLTVDEYRAQQKKDGTVVVVDKSGEEFGEFDSVEKAQDVAESLNISNDNAEFMINFIDYETVNDKLNDEYIPYQELQQKALGMAKASLDRFNKKNNTSIETLEEYYKIPHGKRELTRIKNLLLKDKIVEPSVKPVVITTPDIIEKEERFSTEQISNDPVLTLESLNALNIELQKFKPDNMETSEESVKFVEKGSITENQIEDFLKDIKCYK